jgi:DNA-binding MarR family transcriptional regulator
MDESIKLAFQKVKQDIDSLKEEFDSLKQALIEDRGKISEIAKILTKLDEKIENFKTKELLKSPTDNLQNPTYPTHSPTDSQPLKPLKGQNIGISIGNEGVPTDKQTNQQTNQQTEKTYFGNALEILNSLDNIKKEIRNKFKRITDQEFLVFSTIYQISEETNYVDYKVLSQRLNLTESSIRDYVGRLIKKGIPVEKVKINNKMIRLSISEKLKKIAPLPVIFQLREL